MCKSDKYDDVIRKHSSAPSFVGLSHNSQPIVIKTI